MFAWRDKLCEALKLVPRHCSIPTALKCEISLEVRVEVFLERDISDESHATEGAIKLNPGEDLVLGCLRGANHKSYQTKVRLVATLAA